MLHRSGARLLNIDCNLLFAIIILQAHPGLTAASFPWPSGAAYKLKALTFPYTAGALVYVRDKDSGEVYVGADGLPRIKYWPSAGDRESMMKVRSLLYNLVCALTSCPCAQLFALPIPVHYK